MNDKGRLPRADAQERELLGCVLYFPDRAGEMLTLCAASDFFHDVHQRVWRKFATQYAMSGAIDRLECGKTLNCAQTLNELFIDAPTTTAYAVCLAEQIKLAARGRAIYELLQRGATAILSGRPGDAVLAQVMIAAETLEAEAIGA